MRNEFAMLRQTVRWMMAVLLLLLLLPYFECYQRLLVTNFVLIGVVEWLLVVDGTIDHVSVGVRHFR